MISHLFCRLPRLAAPFSLLFAATASAGINPEHVRFRHYSVEDGLSQSTVNCVLQDHEGFVWLGTQDGLNRFDGYAFKVFRQDPRDSLSISDNYVNCVFEDSRGRLWVGTYNGGMNFYDRDRDAFIHFLHDTTASSSITGNNVWNITENKEGKLLVAVWGGGVNVFDPETRAWTNFHHDPSDPASLADDRVFCLLVDHLGCLWVGTWEGLDRLDPPMKGFTHFRNAPGDRTSLSENRVVSILEDKDGDLWIGTLEGGLNLFDRSRFVRYQKSGVAKNGLTSNRVGALALDGSGTLWISTRDGGINCLDKRSGRISAVVHSPRDPASLNSDAIISLHGDRSGCMWIGTEGSGVSHYDPRRFKFQHLAHEDGNRQSLGSPIVRAVCEDREGNLWVGSMGGNLDCYNAETMKYTHYRDFLLRQGMPGPYSIYALLEDRGGRLWVGSDGGGLYLFDSRRTSIRHFNLDEQDPKSATNYVQTLCETKDGSVWMGTQGGGLVRIDTRTFGLKRFIRRGTDPNQLSGNYIWALHEDGSGRLWIGTWGRGISVLDPVTGRIEVYRHDHSDPGSLSQNSVLCFHEDASGTLWIGTLGGGLDALGKESGRFMHLTEADGLPNNVVNGILEDAEGKLWLSTNKGVSCYSPEKRTFRNYDISDGLQSLEFNQGAYFKGKSGRMYFGGINGVNMFTPESITVDNRVPVLRITAFRIFDRAVPVIRGKGEEQTMVLSYDQNFFSFEFVALAFTAPEKNRYSYKLEGLDKDWISSGARRYTSYTNLDAGEYVFRVRGANSDGVWNTGGTSMRIRVTPPLWERAWFRALGALIVFGIGFTFYHNRVNRLRREKTIQAEFSRKMNEYQETERKRIAGELHDSLGQELLVVRNKLTQCTTAGEQDAALGHQLAGIAETVQQAIDDVRAISSDLHPHMLDRLGLTKTIESMARKCAEAASMEIRALVDDIDKLFSPVEEINVFRIIQEGINNVIKHSRASECELTVRRLHDRCEIVIQDDGCGFEPSKIPAGRSDGGGFGLTNMGERVRLLQGAMNIDSSPGSGTRITFQIPLTPARRRA
jgi:signal transduction histidine kinase/ligand-binding sensor domain-containing protein